MSPGEQRQRLFDRVMRYARAGQLDSMQFFAPMAVMAYEQLGPLDVRARYDFGRVGEMTGDLELASAQADTILAMAPRHLLGLALSARVAALRGDSAVASRMYERFLQSENDERAADRPEYGLLSDELERASADARAFPRR
jgi:hypothetical protein